MRSLGLALLVATTVASPVAAKCRSSAIEVSGGALAGVLSISEPDVVSQFHIWQGPGVRINDKPVHEDPERQQGAFIDWPRGEATGRPKDLERYEVAFLCPEAGDSPHARYVLYYEFDPGHDGGFMSLPGRPDPLIRRMGAADAAADRSRAPRTARLLSSRGAAPSNDAKTK